jgi:hypothetical protein
MTHRIARAIGQPVWNEQAPNLLTLDLRAADEAAMTPAFTRLFRARAS